MFLSKTISVEMFCHSDTAIRLGIDNTLPHWLYTAASNTCDTLEVIQDLLGHKLTLTSLYRSERLNTAIGSRPGSDHTFARAADFRCADFGSPVEIAKFLAQPANMTKAQIGQLILEYGARGWVHVSTNLPPNPINRVISVVAGGRFVSGIKEA